MTRHTSKTPQPSCRVSAAALGLSIKWRQLNGKCDNPVFLVSCFDAFSSRSLVTKTFLRRARLQTLTNLPRDGSSICSPEHRTGRSNRNRLGLRAPQPAYSSQAVQCPRQAKELSEQPTLLQCRHTHQHPEPPTALRQE